MINTLKDNFNRYMREYGQSITINDVEIQAFFNEYNEGKESNDYKYIYSDLGTIKQGDIISALGKRWLVVSNPNNINNTYQKSTIREIKFGLKWNENIIPCIIDSMLSNTFNGASFDIATGNASITLQENDQNKTIAINDVFYVANQKYKVEGMDYSKRGLITFYCSITQWLDSEVHYWGAYGDVEIPTEPTQKNSIRFTVLSGSTPIANATVIIKVKTGEERVTIGETPWGQPIYEYHPTYAETTLTTNIDGFIEIMTDDVAALENPDYAIAQYTYTVVANGYTSIEGTIIKVDIDSNVGIDVNVEM